MKVHKHSSSTARGILCNGSGPIYETVNKTKVWAQVTCKKCICNRPKKEE